MKILETINKMIKSDPSKTTVVMLSAACCIPGMAGFDEQAKKIVEQAISETDANAQLKVVPATTAMFGGGVPRKVLNKLMAMFNQGKMGAPAILINGEVISYGVPTLDKMKEVLNKLPKEKNELNKDLINKMLPNKKTKYLFFGGKGGVGKTTVATATAVWFADHGYKTTIVSTDPTVSLSVVFAQKIGGEARVPIHHVQNLCGLNINPADSKGVFLTRLTGVMSQISGTFGNDVISTPCMEEMATFDQFVTFLEKPDSEVIVFDTAPTGKSLRELAMPFDWAGFMQNQIAEGKKLAELMNTNNNDSFKDLEKDKARYEYALSVLRNKVSTVFNLVLLPERLPIEETQSAITGLDKLGIPVQGIVINQTILPEVIEGNRFLAARAKLQKSYLDEIDTRFKELTQIRLPLLAHDVSNLTSLRKVGKLLYGDRK